ncbi:MAG TPA: hypothetical protein VEG35_02675 [Burkholderiales bacterium]|nr:hypothetical protein [Burkholderiales bacterium]
MRKRTLVVLGIFVAFFAFQSCTSNPEKALLSRYFNAVTMNDNATMASMALEPAQWEVTSWEVVSVSPEKTLPVALPDLNAKEIEAKKAQDAQIGPTMDADAALTEAKDKLDLSRTAGAKAIAKKGVDEAQTKYDAEYAKMKDYKKAYTDAKAAAAGEEQITLFSLGLRELAGVRDLKGDVHSKEVVVRIKTKQGVTKDYRLPMRMYDVKNEAGQRLPSRWVIIRFEPIG